MTTIINFPIGEDTVSGKDVTLDEYWKEMMVRASALGIINSNNRIKTGGLSNNSSKISQSDGKTNVSVQDYGTKETKRKGHLAGKRGHLWCETDNNDPNIKAGWYEISIGNYTSAETRNKERGMYFFMMIDERNGNNVPWTDYFSDNDDTVMVDGVNGDALWN